MPAKIKKTTYLQSCCLHVYISSIPGSISVWCSTIKARPVLFFLGKLTLEHYYTSLHTLAMCCCIWEIFSVCVFKSLKINKNKNVIVETYHLSKNHNHTIGVQEARRVPLVQSHLLHHQCPGSAAEVVILHLWAGNLQSENKNTWLTATTSLTWLLTYHLNSMLLFVKSCLSSKCFLWFYFSVSQFDADRLIVWKFISRTAGWKSRLSGFGIRQLEREMLWKQAFINGYQNPK